MALTEYRRKRHPGRTTEPMPAAAPAKKARTSKRDPIFVVQEHHASALHWDFRLERDGVLVSWAVPKGLPVDPRTNRLAVHVEDHPLEYASFEGTIAEGEYGGGSVTIWDHGTYETEKWSDDEVKVVLHGGRTDGRYVLFKTGGKNWMMHLMKDSVRSARQPLPRDLVPMLTTLRTELPADEGWAFEMKWDGVRALIAVDGGRVHITSRNLIDVTVAYPELRGLGEQLGSTQVLLDGEIVRLDDRGRPDFAALQKRMHVGSADVARRLSRSDPVVFLAFDLLHLDGRSLLNAPYTERRAELDKLALAGPNWQVPPAFEGDGEAAFAASRERGLEGVVAKRCASTYQPGKRTGDWLKIKNVLAQEVVVGGWREGKGRRAGMIGSLVLGIPGPAGLSYCGQVGTGFTQEMLDDLLSRLRRSERKTSPFDPPVPRADARDAHWVTPRLVGEVAFTEWTSDGRLRHPSWRGLRPDKLPLDVVRET